MSIRPVTATSPACYGVCCPRHQACSRYHLVNGMPADAQAISTCQAGAEWPLYIAQSAPKDWRLDRLMAANDGIEARR